MGVFLMKRFWQGVWDLMVTVIGACKEKDIGGCHSELVVVSSKTSSTNFYAHAYAFTSCQYL